MLNPYHFPMISRRSLSFIKGNSLWGECGGAPPARNVGIYLNPV